MSHPMVPSVRPLEAPH